MTTSLASVAADMSSDAGFRTWGLQFNSQLAAVGLVQTADTGQINWSTVVRGSANTIAGTEMWRFNDTQQTGCPIFLQFSYGNQGGPTSPAITVQVGSGSNGAGTLTGPLSTSMSVNSSAYYSGQDSTSRPWAFCLANGQLSIETWGGSPNASGLFMVGRLLNNDGTPSARGMCMGSPLGYFYSTTTGQWTSTSSPTWSYGTSGLSGANIAHMAWQPISPDGVNGPTERTLCTLFSGSADHPYGGVFSIKRWDEVVHSYRKTSVALAGNALHCQLWE